MVHINYLKSSYYHNQSQEIARIKGSEGQPVHCAPRFYGEPKTHKPGVPIRPAVIYSGSLLHSLNRNIDNIVKAYVKDQNNNAKNSATFSNYIRNVPIENKEIIVSFDVTFLYTNIPIIDTLNIIKVSIINIINILLIMMIKLALQWEDQYLQPQQRLISRLINKLQYLRHYTLQKFGDDLLMMLVLFFNLRTWKAFPMTSTILIKTLSLLWRKKAMEN